MYTRKKNIFIAIILITINLINFALVPDIALGGYKSKLIDLSCVWENKGEGSWIFFIFPVAFGANIFKKMGTKVEVTNTKAALLSALTPGVGQFYNKEYGKGIGHLLFTAGSIAGIKYAEKEMNLTECEETLDNLATMKNALWATLGTVWLFSIVDAYKTQRPVKSSSLRLKQRKIQSNPFYLKIGTTLQRNAIMLMLVKSF